MFCMVTVVKFFKSVTERRGVRLEVDFCQRSDKFDSGLDPSRCDLLTL